MDWPLEAGEGIVLEPVRVADTSPLFALIDRDRAHLGRWLPWVEKTQSEADLGAWVERSLAQAARGDGFQCVIRRHREPVGVIGLHFVDMENQRTAVGYWLAAHATGQGIMTRACAALFARCFDEMGLHRIELRAATENTASRAIAERLGMKHEGTLRENELVGGRRLDDEQYGLLSHEWNLLTPKRSRSA